MKNLIITGATRGLGLNHALYLSKEGYNLAIIDISEGASNVYGEMSSVKRLISRLNSPFLLCMKMSSNLRLKGT